ncbi:MAG: FAD-dependent oxidoreductase [Alphaproteobacteria bacterium]
MTLYEASARTGGRMFTQRNFNEDGQFYELGGRTDRHEPQGDTPAGD